MLYFSKYNWNYNGGLYNSEVMWSIVVYRCFCNLSYVVDVSISLASQTPISAKLWNACWAFTMPWNQLSSWHYLLSRRCSCISRHRQPRCSGMLHRSKTESPSGSEQYIWAINSRGNNECFASPPWHLVVTAGFAKRRISVDRQIWYGETHSAGVWDFDPQNR